MQHRTYVRPHVLTILGLGLVGLALCLPTARARAALPDASFLGSAPRLIELPAGRAVTVTLRYKNLSLKAWPATGPGAVTLKLLPSATGALRHRWWRDDVIARLKRPVPPRGVAIFRVPLAGGSDPAYLEDAVALFAGPRRLTGSSFTLSAVVGSNGQPQLAAQVPETIAVTLPVGTEERLPVAVTNVGRRPWDNRGWNRIRLGPLTAPTGEPAAQFRTASWAAPGVASLLPSPRVESGATATLELSVRVPPLPGTYTEDYVLRGAVTGPLTGGRLRVTITAVHPAITTSPTEPLVRVGLFSRTTDPSLTVRANGPASLALPDGTVLLPTVTEVTLGKDGARYSYAAGETTGTVDQPLRVVGPATTVLELVDWENRPSWDRTLNDNLVRGTVEFRTAATGTTWIINELPIESYLLGLAETSSRSPLEFRQALIAAARTYALHHAAKKTKHADENYDLNATTDQVYRGYGHEVRSPSVREAVEATRGLVIFHPAARTDRNPNGIIVAAYSACTDGRTRSFQEAFGGDGALTPYLVSVPDPDGICVNERYRRGLDGNHMVGLSGNGGIEAAKAGRTSLEILTYYYTGVTVTKYYE